MAVNPHQFVASPERVGCLCGEKFSMASPDGIAIQWVEHVRSAVE